MIDTNKIISSQRIQLNPILESILTHNTFSNAYIFYGPDGVEKKEAAINFISRLINKANTDINPFEQIRANNFPDFKLIEPTYLIKGKLFKIVHNLNG